jgi:hypothetical protein
MHYLKTIRITSNVNYGGMSISIATGCPRPEVKSSVDRATMVFYLCLLASTVCLLPFRRYRRLPLAETGVMTNDSFGFRALRMC